MTFLCLIWLFARVSGCEVEDNVVYCEYFDVIRTMNAMDIIERYQICIYILGYARHFKGVKLEMQGNDDDKFDLEIFSPVKPFTKCGTSCFELKD